MPLYSSHENVSGLVERVTYHNPDNGFCVLRIQVKGKKDLLTVTGNASTIWILNNDMFLVIYELLKRREKLADF